MGKVVRWVEAVIANNHPYAPMAGVDIKKSADQLFDGKDEKQEQNNPEPENTSER